MKFWHSLQHGWTLKTLHCQASQTQKDKHCLTPLLWGSLLLLFSSSVVSGSVRPHRRQPTRLPRPWDSPGKNTRVGCHFLLQWVKVKSESEVAQSCQTLRDPIDHSLPGSAIHGILQARVLEWVATTSPSEVARAVKFRATENRMVASSSFVVV